MDFRNGIINRPFAVMPRQLGALFETVRTQASKPAAALPRGSAIAPGNRSGTRIAVLPLFGFLSQRLNPMDFAGDTSLEAFGAVFNQVLQDPYVDSIVIEVDSPGGSVYGVDELAARIFAARGRKRIAAIANSLSASAAYWIMTAAGELSCTPSGEVGSIGIVAVHQDWSRAEDRAGLHVTHVSAGKYNTEGNQHEPLGGTARGALQNRVDQYYGMFVRAVARHRAAPIAKVHDGFGEGRTVGAADALKMGMVDRIETMDELLTRLASGRIGR
jgi:signal peptide peptidase SppA